MTEKKPFEGPYAEWVKGRMEVVQSSILISDVLIENGVRLRYGGSRAEQVFCPFHSNNHTMAAKYHPEEEGSHGGIYCFVCQKRWDIFGVWREFKGMQEAKFTAVLRSIERAYNITPPEVPEGSTEYKGDPSVDEQADLDALFDVCERRLLGAREVFDLKGYLTLGVVLDRLRGQVGHRKVSIADARVALGKVLDKIGSRCRAS